MSIRVRLTLFGLLVVTLTLLAFTLVFFGLLQAAGSGGQDQRLAERARQAVAALAAAPSGDFAPRSILAPVDAARSDEMFLAVLRQDGALIASTGVANGSAPVVPAAVLSAVSRGGTLATLDAGPGQRVRAYLLPWKRTDLAISGYVVAAQSTRKAASDITVARIFVMVAAVFAFVIAAIAIWLVIGRALRPLRELAALTDEVGRTNDLARRLPVPAAHDDLRRLSDSFNGMMARLEDARSRLSAALESQKRFVADASHELRTPLTTIRSNAGFLLQHPEARADDRAAALRDIATESERMSRLVRDLLTLARADGGFELERTAVDLSGLVAGVAEQAARLFADRRVEAHLQPAVVDGNADALRQVLWILLDNAASHTQRNGHIRILLETGGGATRMTVTDDGEGIPEGADERIFGRFYQADASRARSGAGLGLSIARWIVGQHGGTISARNAEGGGATFCVDLPEGTPLASGEGAAS